MKVGEVLKRLRADGWEIVTQRGSHRQMKHATKPGRDTVTGPESDDIHPKTLASTRRQSGPQALR